MFYRTIKDGNFVSGFHLPVSLELSDKSVIDLIGLQDIQKYLATDIILVNKNIQNVAGLKCVCITDITIAKAQQLCFGFVVESLQELDEFVALAQSGELSRTFTQYAEENSVQLVAGYGLSCKLRCQVEIGKETIEEGKTFFAAKTPPSTM